jgi:uncharacterized protein YyaL (SSP411 family)
MELRDKLASAKRKLYEVRAQRVWPGRDEKILTAWNAIMLAAFAQAGAVFEEPRYLEAATRAADFILTRLRMPDGRLYRTCGVDSPAKLNGYLEDYAYLVDALVTLYESTFEPRWLHEASKLAKIMIDQFYDEKDGGFFATAKEHESLIARTKEIQDTSTPSGNGMAAMGLLRLAAITGRDDFRETAVGTLNAYFGFVEESPIACGQMLLALDFLLGPIQEIAVVGNSKENETKRVLQTIRRGFRPNLALAFREKSAADGDIALLKDRQALGPVTTYICRNFTCEAPLVSADAAVEALKRDV